MEQWYALYVSLYFYEPMGIPCNSSPHFVHTCLLVPYVTNLAACRISARLHSQTPNMKYTGPPQYKRHMVW